MAVLRETRVLDASLACIRVLLDTEDPNAGIDEICRRTGLSPRTFHRYFVTRAQMIRPALADMTRRFDDAVATVAGSLAHRAVAAFEAEVVAHRDFEAVRLIGLLRQRRDLWAAYLESIEYGESHLAEVLVRIEPRTTPLGARVRAASIVAASRLALDGAVGGEDPVKTFQTCIELSGIGSEAHGRDET